MVLGLPSTTSRSTGMTCDADETKLQIQSVAERSLGRLMAKPDRRREAGQGPELAGGKRSSRTTPRTQLPA